MNELRKNAPSPDCILLESGGPKIAIQTPESARSQFRSTARSSWSGRLTNPLALDLLRIGQAVFLADRAVRRGRYLGSRTRNLKLTVPVRHPHKWRKEARALAHLAGFVSHDRWRFAFIKTEQVDAPSKEEKKVVSADAVALFSEGLDSLCGLAEMLRAGIRPILVTHSPPGFDLVRKRANRLKESLKCPFPIHQIGFHFVASDKNAKGKRSLFPERSRRTRPFWYLCMAGAVAIDQNVSQIYLNENGPLAINLPFSRSQTGMSISRHAHPAVLRGFQTLLGSIWPHRSSPPSVGNLLFEKTKGAQLADLKNFGDLIKETITCEYARQTLGTLKHRLGIPETERKHVKQCGLCMACLVRQAALHKAGIREEVVVPGGKAGGGLSGISPYVFDPRKLLKDGYRGEPLNFLNNVGRHASELKAFSRDFEENIKDKKAFAIRYAPELALLALDKPVEQTAEETHALYRSFAKEILQFLEPGT